MWFFNKKKKIRGYIRLYSLEDWWADDLSEEERKYILATYLPMGGDGKSLIEEDIKAENFIGSPRHVVHFLSSLASWFKRKNDRHIARKIFKKTLSLVDNNTKVLDLHFMYQHIIQIYYKDRKTAEYYNKAIWACNEQIKLAKHSPKAFYDEWGDTSLPRHVGYDQLVIVLEKEKKYNEAIALCTQAKDEGWNGDWDKRISRCKKKRDK